MPAPDPFPTEELGAAVRASVLAVLPATLRDAALVGAVRSEVPKGRRLEGPPLCLVVTGLIRVALASSEGHRFAVAYLHRGDIAGLARLTGRRSPLEFETVTDCRLLFLHEGTFDDLRRSHAAIGVAITDQLNRHLDDTLSETALAAFSHVRERVLWHLLARADIDPHGPITCRMTHQELADAVGSVRETVTRILGDLKSDGLVEPNHGCVVIPDPQRLRRELGS